MDEFDGLKRSGFFLHSEVCTLAVVVYFFSVVLKPGAPVIHCLFSDVFLTFVFTPYFFCVLWLSVQVFFFHVFYCLVLVIYCLSVLCTHSFTV